MKKQRILIVDDDENIAELISLYLMKECFDTEIVNDGESALTKISTFNPDLILLDIRMPEMDGLEAAAAIRALARSDAKTIPIIALTANAFDEDVQRSLQVGMDAHLSKPVDPEHLYQTLEELIWEYDMKK